MAEEPFTPCFLVIEGEDPRYELRGKLGEGGMAEVFRAKDHLIGEIVAIKIPKGELYDNAEAAPRFRREAYVLSQLQHPNIVRFLDWGVCKRQRQGGERSDIFYVMEFFDGSDLSDMIDNCLMELEDRPIKGSLIAFQDIVDIVLQMLDALHEAHSKGFVHRDLKPANIMLCREFDGIKAKLADFGIAKILKKHGLQAANRTTLTKENRFPGTPTYMAPEMARNNSQVDERADLYALGAIVYEMVTGRSTVSDIEECSLDVFIRLNSDEPFAENLYPSKLFKGVDSALEKWILTLLKRDPDERFQTALEAARHFRQKVARMPTISPVLNKPKTSGIKRIVTFCAFVAIALGIPVATLYLSPIDAVIGGASAPVVSMSETSERSAKVAVTQPSASASAKPTTGLTLADLPEPDRVRFQKVVKQMKVLRPKTKCPRSLKHELLYFDATYLSLADVKYWIAGCFYREGQIENAELFHEQYRALSGGLEKPP
ncbi:MAG: serine/threonine-protein kinase [Patescibacteria group bacterium]